MFEGIKSPDDVRRYHEAFWIHGSTHLPNWESIQSSVVSAERKLREAQQFQRSVAGKLVRVTDDPWTSEALVSSTKPHPGGAVRKFTASDDRNLLCAVRHWLYHNRIGLRAIHAGRWKLTCALIQ